MLVIGGDLAQVSDCLHSVSPDDLFCFYVIVVLSSSLKKNPSASNVEVRTRNTPGSWELLLGRLVHDGKVAQWSIWEIGIVDHHT
jgi:hypothetical protein